MQSTAFNIGDVVQIASRSLSGSAAKGAFTILRAYPVEHMEPVYRIRSLEDRQERMVPGSELRRAPAQRTDPFSAFGRFA